MGALAVSVCAGKPCAASEVREEVTRDQFEEGLRLLAPVDAVALEEWTRERVPWLARIAAMDLQMLSIQTCGPPQLLSIMRACNSGSDVA